MEEARQIFVATETFAADVDGVPYMIRKGVDRVRGAHPLYQRTKAAGYWAPISDNVHYDVETATAEPGQRREASVTLEAPPEAASEAPVEPAATAAKAKSAGTSK